MNVWSYYGGSQDHARKGQPKRDYFIFRYELASGLIGEFKSCLHTSHRRSDEHMQLERLNTSLGHWPQQVSLKRKYVVCQPSILNKSPIGNRHNQE